ncbi:sulfatase-like hydrolase/transferase [Mameliella alba]|nr:sulfatase-like hydrolase/transferase [Mameliella alba]MBY6169628.1 sulfatase-like hydrolase/transferase [Mameliella alba]MBY6174647.1 sulfatase-like hydrolase/transferase [Mameliella alba]
MTRRNILWIMCDQLRFDYLSCAGHPTLQTPNIDALAARGVRFSNAYVQSPICGPSRMSYYTGRYPSTHGSLGNDFPLNVGERTLGDHLRPLGMQAVLCGKTHMRADVEGMQRLGIDPNSVIGARVSECGFDVWDRHDGLYPTPKPDQRYNRFLAERGYGSDNPWHDNANSGRGPMGEVRSGWFLENATLPAAIRPEEGETPYIVDRSIEFIEQAGDDPWLLHCSFIKPHWPLIAPPPYHDMFGAADILPPVRSDAERADPHPVYAAFMRHKESLCYSDDRARPEAIATYMGLIRQVDDEVGRLVAYLRNAGKLDQTMIVFCSDHGDYLGDHWLGEKDLFHDPSAKVPLIVVDPSPEADGTRGTVCDALVEAIDLAPSFVEWAGGTPAAHVFEGRSLLPFLHGRAPDQWRRAVFSEYDFIQKPAGAELDLGLRASRLYMVRTGRWKAMFAPPFRPMLFDLVADPQELNDLGATPPDGVVEELRGHLLTWALGLKRATTLSDAGLMALLDEQDGADGIWFGVWNRESATP